MARPIADNVRRALTKWLVALALPVGLPLLAGGCSLKQIALRSVADTMSESGTTYARDDDPELVRDAIPFVLKLMEQIHDGVPKHKGLCLALARTATSYGVVFVADDADRTEEVSVPKSKPLRVRARRLLLRGRDYGLAGLDLALPQAGAGLSTALKKGDAATRDRLLAQVKAEDAGLLYWTGAAWASAISNSRDDLKLVGELPQAVALMKRALELAPDYEEGAVQEFFGIYLAGKDKGEGGGIDVAKRHFARARELSKNKRLGVLVNQAEVISVQTQNRAEFEALLKEVVAYDVDSDLDHRLVNVLAQRRAAWLLARTDELFAN